MTSQPDYANIATTLVGGQPLDYKIYPDGSLVVIAPTGQKYNFSIEQMNKIQISFTRKENAKSSAVVEKPTRSSTSVKSSAREIPKTAAQRGRPRKTPAG